MRYGVNKFCKNENCRVSEWVWVMQVYITQIYNIFYINNIKELKAKAKSDVSLLMDVFLKVYKVKVVGKAERKKSVVVFIKYLNIQLFELDINYNNNWF